MRERDLLLNRRTVVAGGALSLATTLSACGGGGLTTPPIDTSITVEAAANINPNELDEPAPTVIRIFELQDVTEFNQAQLFELLEDPQAAIGSNFIGFQEVVIQPGQTETLTKSVNGETRFLGVAAGFRDIDSADWRKTFELNPKRTNTLKIQVTALAISVTEVKQRRLGIL